MSRISLLLEAASGWELEWHEWRMDGITLKALMNRLAFIKLQFSEPSGPCAYEPREWGFYISQIASQKLYQDWHTDEPALLLDHLALGTKCGWSYDKQRKDDSPRSRSLGNYEGNYDWKNKHSPRQARYSQMPNIITVYKTQFITWPNSRFLAWVLGPFPSFVGKELCTLNHPPN